MSKSEEVRDVATPRPWKQSCFLIEGPRGEWVTHTGMGNLPPSRSHESEANAALIVAAVNAFDPRHTAAVKQLVDALKKLSIRQGKDSSLCWCNSWDWTVHSIKCSAARAALKFYKSVAAPTGMG